MGRAKQINAGVAREGFRDCHSFRFGRRIYGLATKTEFLTTDGANGFGNQGRAIIHQDFVGLIRPVPFQHRKFRVMQGTTLSVSENPGKIENTGLAGRQ